MALSNFYMVMILTILANLDLTKEYSTQKDDGNGSLVATVTESLQFTNQPTVATRKWYANVTEYAKVTDYTNGMLSNWPEHESVKSTVAVIDTGIMSRQTYKSFEYVALYIQFILIAVAIVVNFFNIAVFTQTRMRSATSTILACLSCSEMGFAVSELIISSFSASLGPQAHTSKHYWTLLRWLRVYLVVVFQRSSFCFNLSVATERFIAVSFPLKSSRILKHKNPAVFCVFLFLAILTIHIFNPLKLDVVAINTGHGYIHIIQRSQIYEESSDVFDGLTLATKIIFAYIPLFGCLLMNVLMVVALKKHNKNRKMLQTSIEAHRQNDRHEVQTTITVLLSSLLFVLFSLPVTTHSIVASLVSDYANHKKEHYVFSFITYLFGLFSLTSLSMDFFVYMILGRAFRRTFFHLLNSVYSVIRHCCRQSNRNSNPDIPAVTVLSELDSNSMSIYSCAVKYEETDTNM